jgi:hypothetical protein
MTVTNAPVSPAISGGHRLARSLGLGRAALALYHRPVGLVRKSIAEGGPGEQWRTERGRRAMVNAATSLAPITAPAIDRGARVSFLSGAAHWYQTLFCFASFQAQTPERITPVIFEDGTMTPQVRGLMRRIVPWIEFPGLESVEERFDRLLPAATFPSLRGRRVVNPILRQLTDVHLSAPGWTLYADSDMLFFRRPDALHAWFSEPHAVFMQDIATVYGYSPALMKELAGLSIPNRINAGLYALHSPSIDWGRVEYWCRTQIEKEGIHYLQPQSLIALLMANASGKPLSAEDYVILPSLDEGRAPTAVLHHYVAHSKRSYFQHGWRHVLDHLQQPA